jgi:hypothetical protein
MKRITIGVAAVLLTVPGFAKGDPQDPVVLYQPDAVIGHRLGGDVQNFATFILKAQDCWAQVMTNVEARSRTALVVAFGAGRLPTAWIVGSTNTSADGAVSRRLRGLKIPHVTDGFVAFAVVGKNYEYGSQEQKEFTPPCPNAWKQLAKKGAKSMSTDDILDLLLPKEPEETAPTQFVVQVLEPTGGRISRPKEWFYAENHNGHRYMWTISREDASKGSYTTGVRIQTFVGVKDGTGKTPKDFVLDFVAARKKEATRIITTRDEKEQYLFTRIGLETEEGPYHILYSLFWGTGNLDVAVIVISGTTKDLWAMYAPTFDKMNAFELIDMKRFDK